MYKINDNTYAIEKGDNVKFIRDGGGEIDILTGKEKHIDSEEGPRIIEKDEAVILTVMPIVPF